MPEGGSMKPNVKIVVKVDGEVFMELNLTASDMEWVGRLCDDIDETVSHFFQCGASDGMAIEEVEPTFRADE